VLAVTNASEHSHQDPKDDEGEDPKALRTTAVTWQLYFTKVKD
jgi:hypothetical protein